jgi:YVTN family beta-propeller protein
MRENTAMPLHKGFWLLTLAAVLTAAETPSRALIVLNKTDATLAIVDPASGKVAARVPTGAGPHEVAVSTDGKFAYVGNYGDQTPGSTLSVIDLVAQKELHRVDLGPLRRPHGIAFADGKVYFTAEVNKLIARYNPATNQVDWLLGTGQNSTHMVLISKDNNKMFTANIGSDSITIIERAGAAGWNETVVPVGKGPEAIDLSPDGKEVWTAHSRDGGVSIIDIAGKKVVHTLNLQTKRSNRLKFTPDGKLVLISDLEAGDLLVIDAQAHKEIKRVKLGANVEGVLVEPDGLRAYVAVTGANSIAVIDLKTLDVVSHISTGNGPDGMAWAVRK